MNRTSLLPTLLAASLAAWLPLQAASGNDSPPDPLKDAFFPPELVLVAGERIGLTEGQRETIRTRIEKMETRFAELRKRLEREISVLADLANKERVDEAALSAQLDKMLDAERDVKRLQVSLLAAIKNLLTPEQQSKLRELSKNGAAKLLEETRQRIEGKVAQVQAGAQKWAESGRDPSDIARAMQEELKPLLDVGKILEAETVLDRLLRQLNAENK